jgi:hypothetical protein
MGKINIEKKEYSGIPADVRVRLLRLGVKLSRTVECIELSSWNAGAGIVPQEEIVLVSFSGNNFISINESKAKTLTLIAYSDAKDSVLNLVSSVPVKRMVFLPADSVALNWMCRNVGKCEIKSDSQKQSQARISVSSVFSSDTEFHIDSFHYEASSFKLSLDSVNYAESKVRAKAIIPEKALGVSCAIDLFSLVEGGSVELSPFIEISNDNIKASHSALARGYDKAELFYLYSKGLSEEEARILIRKNILLRNLPEEEFEQHLERWENELD